MHRRQAHVLQGGHVLEQAVKLKHQPDTAPEAVQHRAIGPAPSFEARVADLDGAAVERIESRNRAKDRGLARSGRSAKRDEIAGPGLEVHLRHEHTAAPRQLDIANRQD